MIPDFDAVEAIIREVAAVEIMPRFRNLHSGDIAFKEGDDPVTVADKAAEKALSERLRSLLPGSVIVGEEECSANPAVLKRFKDDAPIWVIDPLDGTKNFVAGKPVFGVIIALVQNNQTLAGWLYDPNSDEFVTAEQGSGAWHQGQRLSVLPPAPLEMMRGSLAVPMVDVLETATFPTSSRQPLYSRSMLCICHEYARLVVQAPHFARPETPWNFQTVVHASTPWDCAAGGLIHREAGGHAAHWNGDPVSPSVYHRSILSAPDAASWRELRDWIAGFCPLEA